jgi:arsenate reductase (thioredoxin)
MTQQIVKKKVLFICEHNSARSQMAEGLLKSLYGEIYEVYSAGSNPSNISPYAVKVMAEIGIDISDYRSKSLKEFEGVTFDYVATVCSVKVKYVLFSLEEKSISTNHLKTLKH